jgi:septal ring factor EnvC (AmiA/AmiB activator)
MNNPNEIAKEWADYVKRGEVEECVRIIREKVVSSNDSDFEIVKQALRWLESGYMLSSDQLRAVEELTYFDAGSGSVEVASQRLTDLSDERAKLQNELNSSLNGMKQVKEASKEARELRVKRNQLQSQNEVLRQELEQLEGALL